MKAAFKLLSILSVPSALIVFLVFLKIGFMFFGGGYTVIPVMHREIVVNHHYLTNQEFIQGIAISQLTPGPVAVIATFAGYKMLGVIGAFVGTVGMFLPGSVLMLTISKNYEKITNSSFATKVLNTIIPVIVGLLIGASWQMGKTVSHGVTDIAIFLASLFLLLKYKTNPALLIFTAGLIGILLKM